MQNTRKKGFSLIELMTVVAIIAILAAVSIPMYSKFNAQARSDQASSALALLKARQETYRASHFTYASDLSELPGYDQGGSGQQELDNYYYIEITAAGKNTFSARAWDGLDAIGSKGAGADEWEIDQDDKEPRHISYGY